MTRRRHLALAASGVASLLGVAGCSLTSSERDPVQVKLDDVDRRVGQVERVVNNQSLVELHQRVEALQNEMRLLRGQLEELENANEALRKQQRDMYADLDARLSNAPTASPPATPTPADSVPEAGQKAYGRAFDALKAGQYPQAIKGFQEFLAQYPQGPLSDNAQYWLGEAYYVTRDYDSALAAFQRVTQVWPDSRKAPDALVKQGFTLFELKRFTDARRVLGEVPQRFPGTEAARLAAERLKRIPADAR